jgi:hypothetical protein
MKTRTLNISKINFNGFFNFKHFLSQLKTVYSNLTRVKEEISALTLVINWLVPIASTLSSDSAQKVSKRNRPLIKLT